MDKVLIFESIKKYTQLYLQKFSLSYELDSDKLEGHCSINNYNYETYIQKWYNCKLNLELSIHLTYYIQYPNEEMTNKYVISIYLSEYRNGVLQRYLDINDYFVKMLHVSIDVLDSYEGISVKEKIHSFFEWFGNNCDARLIKILDGRDWIDIPFDWHDYK